VQRIPIEPAMWKSGDEIDVAVASCGASSRSAAIIHFRRSEIEIDEIQTPQCRMRIGEI
jgi:hypothetical protein